MIVLATVISWTVGWLSAWFYWRKNVLAMREDCLEWENLYHKDVHGLPYRKAYSLEDLRR